MDRKKKLGMLLAVCMIANIMFTSFVPEAKGKENEIYPTVYIKVHKIQKLEGGDSDESKDVDFTYYVSVYNTKTNEWETKSHDCPWNDPAPIIDITDSFQVYSRNVRIIIWLVDRDDYSPDDSFDISSKKGGGERNNPYVEGAVYHGYFDIATDSLTGDKTEKKFQYYVTSGEYDGSIDVKENDAMLYFDIWDNYEPPVADAGKDRIVKVNDLVDFDGTKSYAHGSTIVKYRWDFNGDGIYDAEGAIASHRYTEKGIYKVTLKVIDNIGVENKDSCTIYVETRPPVCDFAWTPEDPKTSEEVHFIDKSYDPDGKIVSWHWDFGDGTISTSQNPIHKYSKAGTYFIKLTVTDNDGATTTNQKKITINKRAKTNTPGFDSIISIASVALAFIIIKRKRE